MRVYQLLDMFKLEVTLEVCLSFKSIRDSQNASVLKNSATGAHSLKPLAFYIPMKPLLKQSRGLFVSQNMNHDVQCLSYFISTNSLQRLVQARSVVF